MILGINNCIISWDLSYDDKFVAIGNEKSQFCLPVKIDYGVDPKNLDSKDSNKGKKAQPITDPKFSIDTTNLLQNESDVSCQEDLNDSIICVKFAYDKKHIYVLTLYGKLSKFIIEASTSKPLNLLSTKIRITKNSNIKTDENGTIALLNELSYTNHMKCGQDISDKLYQTFDQNEKRERLTNNSKDPNALIADDKKFYKKESANKLNSTFYVLFQDHVIILNEDLCKLSVLQYNSIFCRTTELISAAVTNSDIFKNNESIGTNLSSVQKMKKNKKKFWIQTSPRIVFLISNNNNRIISNCWKTSVKSLQYIAIDGFNRVYDYDKKMLDTNFQNENINIWPSQSYAIGESGIHYFNFKTRMNYFSSVILSHMFPASLKVNKGFDLYIDTFKNSMMFEFNKMLVYMISTILNEAMNHSENVMEQDKDDSITSEKSIGNKLENHGNQNPLEVLKSKVSVFEKIQENNLLEKCVYHGFIKEVNDYFDFKSEKVFAEYRKCKIISKTDILVMVYTLQMLDQKVKIPEFFKAIFDNPIAILPKFDCITKIVFNLQVHDSIIEGLMEILAENQFKKIKKFTHGTNELIEKRFTKSRKTVHGFSELHDKPAFFITENERGPIPTELYLFKLPINLTWPNSELLKYIQNQNDYLNTKHAHIWTNHIFEAWINKLWGYYRIQMQVYLAFSIIPLILNFMICLYSKADHDSTFSSKMEIIHMLAGLCVPSVFIIILYEIVQSQAIGKRYFKDIYNWIDFFTQGFILFSMCFLFGKIEMDDWDRTFICISLLLQTFKLVLNLRAIDFIRMFGSKLVRLIYSLFAFFIIVALFLLCFTNIFYITEFYYDEEDQQQNTWGRYFIQTYFIFFAAWIEPTIRSSGFYWVKILFVLFTILFTVVVFNILIAILSNVWGDLMAENQMDDNVQKLDMVNEVIEMRVWLKNFLNYNKKVMKNNINKNKNNHYFAFRKRDNVKQTNQEYRDKLTNDFSQIDIFLKEQKLKFTKIEEADSIIDSQQNYDDGTEGIENPVPKNITSRDQNIDESKVNNIKEIPQISIKHEKANLPYIGIDQLIRLSEKFDIFDGLVKRIDDIEKAFETEDKRILDLENEKLGEIEIGINAITFALNSLNNKKNTF